MSIASMANVKVGKENAPPKSKGVEPEIEAERSFEGSCPLQINCRATADLLDMQGEEGKTSKSNGKITAKAVSKNQEDNQPERPVEKKGPSSESSKKLAHVRGTF